MAIKYYPEHLPPTTEHLIWGGGGHVVDNTRGYTGSYVRTWYDSNDNYRLYVLDITPTYIAVFYGSSYTYTSFCAITRGWSHRANLILESTTGENEIVLQRCTAEESAAIIDRVPASWNVSYTGQVVGKILLPQ